VKEFEDAVATAVTQIPEATLVRLATAIANGGPVPAPWAGPGAEQLALLIPAAAAYGPGHIAAAAYLRGATAGYFGRASEQQVQVVWGGPTMHAVPTRSMGQVLAELIGRSAKSLILMTYSAKPYPPVIAALSAALTRGVEISVVIETLSGAGSAITGDEPAAAFAGLPGVDLWRWPKSNRPSEHAKMHAKIAVADERELLIGSANLTASGIEQSMEAALLITGGHAPRRTAALFRELVITKQFMRIN
jgi:phosphatidylserine/phosphatidylglycerophosphate/cardiolipin synthase-like enzyme